MRAGFSTHVGPPARRTEGAIRYRQVFLASQTPHYSEKTEEKVWTDFCQMLFASNAFLYVE